MNAYYKNSACISANAKKVFARVLNMFFFSIIETNTCLELQFYVNSGIFAKVLLLYNVHAVILVKIFIPRKFPEIKTRFLRITGRNLPTLYFKKNFVNLFATKHFEACNL
jgi:hypothetical protein